MTAPIPIDHHFTPIFYLNAWANSDGRAIRYSRPVDAVVAKSCAPSRTGSERHLYTLHGVPPDRQAALETDFFAPVDSRAAVVHRSLLSGHLKELSMQERCDWARFMMSMTLRSPFSLGEVERLADQTMRATMLREDSEYNDARKPGDPETMFEWVAKYHPEIIANAHKQFLPAMIDHENLGQYLVNMVWATLDVRSARHSLLTGDRPFTWGRGWKDPQTALTFPLGPGLLFVATNGLSQMQSVFRRPLGDVVRIVNEQTVGLAVDFVVGSDASQLAFVERHLRRLDQEPAAGAVGRGRPGCPP